MFFRNRIGLGLVLAFQYELGFLNTSNGNWLWLSESKDNLLEGREDVTESTQTWKTRTAKWKGSKIASSNQDSTSL